VKGKEIAGMICRIAGSIPSALHYFTQPQLRSAAQYLGKLEVRLEVPDMAHWSLSPTAASSQSIFNLDCLLLAQTGYRRPRFEWKKAAGRLCLKVAESVNTGKIQ
jgi:hypothetical protein